MRSRLLCLRYDAPRTGPSGTAGRDGLAGRATGPLGRRCARLAAGRDLPGPGPRGWPSGPGRCGCGWRRRWSWPRWAAPAPARAPWSTPWWGPKWPRTGQSRPPPRRPTLICRPDLTPEMLGIDPASVELVAARPAGAGRPGADRLPRPRHHRGDRVGRARTWPGCGSSCRTATCCWSPPRSRSTAAPGWPTSWPRPPAGPGWSSSRPTPTWTRTSATTGARCSRTSTRPGTSSWSIRSAALADAQSGLAAAGRVRRAGRPAYPATGRHGRRADPPGELPRPGRETLGLRRADRRGHAGGAASSRRRSTSSEPDWPASWPTRCGPSCWPAGGSGRTGWWARSPPAGVSAPSRWCCGSSRGSAGCSPARC